MKMYVLHTSAGKECSVCSKLINVGVAAFVPIEQALIRREGMWSKENRILFPGYVFVSADIVPEVYYSIKRTDGVIRFLGSPPTALSSAEQARIEWLCNGGRMIEPSVISVSETGEIIVLDGILKGNESVIKRYNRRQKKVIAEIRIGGKRHTFKLSVTEEQ